jgi:hypothetical protein
MRLIFLKLHVDIEWQHKRAQRRQCEPLEEFSFLFNRSVTLKLDWPELRLLFWKSTIIYEVSGEPTMALENLREWLIPQQVVPTTASGLQGV